MLHPKWIVGKTVARVETRPFEANQYPAQIGRRTAHDPVIYFTDGSSIRFVTEETEVGEYGVDIIYYRKKESQ